MSAHSKKHHDHDCGKKHKYIEHECFPKCHKKDCCPQFHCLPVPFCDDRIHLRLAGLTGNLTFQLFRLKGCKLEMEIDCLGQREKVKGVVCNVGTDFVDILKENKTVTTVLINRIASIDWQGSDCNPCHPQPCPPTPCHPC